MTEPVHNSATAMATGKPLLAHGDQETRQLVVMQGQSGVMLVQALSTPRGVLNESQWIHVYIHAGATPQEIHWHGPRILELL